MVCSQRAARPVGDVHHGVPTRRGAGASDAGRDRAQHQSGDAGFGGAARGTRSAPQLHPGLRSAARAAGEVQPAPQEPGGHRAGAGRGAGISSTRKPESPAQIYTTLSSEL